MTFSFEAAVVRVNCSNLCLRTFVYVATRMINGFHYSTKTSERRKQRITNIMCGKRLEGRCDATRGDCQGRCFRGQKTHKNGCRKVNTTRAATIFRLKLFCSRFFYPRMPQLKQVDDKKFYLPFEQEKRFRRITKRYAKRKT